MRLPRKPTALFTAALLALSGGAAAAHAELAQNGNIRIAFSGGIFPIRLPRSGSASVSVRMGGKISTTDKSTPPELKTIEFDINRHGVIQTAGLPTCSIHELESISSNAARRACGGALVGHGNVTSRVALPGQGAFATNGPLLAFNGKLGGRPAILAQVSSKEPLPLTYVIPFQIRKARGEYGTSLVAQMPPIASHYGYISAFDLTLGRQAATHGRGPAYASASCPTPSGFSGAAFAFAKASYSFADGRTVSSVLERECKVRG